MFDGSPLVAQIELGSHDGRERETVKVVAPRRKKKKEEEREGGLLGMDRRQRLAVAREYRGEGDDRPWGKTRGGERVSLSLSV